MRGRTIKTFKEILKKLRKEKGITSEELANELGVSTSTILMWESGERAPKKENISTICSFFGCDYNYLGGLSEIKNTTSDVQNQIPIYREGELIQYMLLPSILLRNDRKYFAIIEVDDEFPGLKKDDIAIFDKCSNALVLTMKKPELCH